MTVTPPVVNGLISRFADRDAYVSGASDRNVNRPCASVVVDALCEGLETATVAPCDGTAAVRDRAA